METQQKRQWGVTSAISEAHPTKADLELNDQLLDYLKKQNNFETPEGSERRVQVLNHFQKVTEEFVRRVLKRKSYPQSTIDNAGGRIFPFGSYALGVYGPGSDIDTLVVAPNHVSIDDFFDHFPNTLRDMSPAKDIQSMNPVKETFVPLIKIEYAGVDIDLLFVCLPSKSSIGPDLDLKDTNILRGLDDCGIRSLNGTRVTDELLSNVPQVKVFRHATRAIKLWANRRGVYGAMYGFPGGVAWAIMVARICQLYPYACGATIVSKFFSLMQKWYWPRPVMVTKIAEAGMGRKVWNPTIYPADKANLMPVITPAFPAMCSTYTITQSTKKVMLKEFDRASSIAIDIIEKKKSWADLFETHTFFSKDHKYYLSIIAASRTKDSHETWSGWVNSKVRILAKGIDESEAGVECARPWMKSFERIHRCKTEDEVERVCQGKMDFVVKDQDEQLANGDSSEYPYTIFTTTSYIGMTLQEGSGRHLDISYPVQQFKRTVMDSESYDEINNSVRIIHTRNFDLPDDVFEPGEKRPVKTTKAKKPKQLGPKGGVKRSQNEAGLDDEHAASTKRRQAANGVAAPA